ncbi:MAG TPA: hypothetical protein VGD19_05270 [Allosphingosinicella sp.]|jgi:hypothetical protein
MKRLLIALVLLTGCSGDGEGEGEGNQARSAAPAAGGKSPAGGGRLTSLTGLYEGGEVSPPNQLCVVEGGGEPRFGLVVWGSNLHSCSGSGTASRSGDRLRLRMTGDEACTIDAAISGTTIVLPSAVPDGCAYYCGERATMNGAQFTQKGDTAADAAKARDLVGDPLCTGG